MGRIEVEPGAKLFVQDTYPEGNETIVFLHGWPLNHKTFEYQYNVFPQHGYRCVGVDLRGFGQSDKPWGGYGYDRMSDDVFEVIRAMGLRGVTLAGHSMGGAIAIRYMARHGGYGVGRLALLAAAAPSFTQRPDYPYGMPRQQVNGLIAGLFRNRPEVLVEFGNMFFYKPVTASFMSWFQGTGLEASGYATIHALESLRDEFLGNDLPHIKAPTGIFHGIQDRVCPFQFALEQQAAIEGSVLFRFSQSGHAVYYDELDRFNQTLLYFMEHS